MNREDYKEIKQPSLFSSIISRLWYLPFIVAYVAASITFEGYVAVTLWTWFVTSAFNIAAPSIAQACGLILAFQFIMYRFLRSGIGHGALAAALFVARPFWLGAFFLLIGWIITLFI